MANFITKVKINGVEKALDVVGRQTLEPIATIDGVGYVHSINVADLDITKIYDLEGNELGSEPQDDTPYIKNVGFAGSQWFGAINIIENNSSKVILSTGGQSFGQPLTEGAVEGLSTNFDNAYVKINEDNNNYATLYFNLAGEGQITGPVSNEELDRNVNNLTRAIEGKQDKLTVGNNISIEGNRNVISASVVILAQPTATAFEALYIEVHESPFYAKFRYPSSGGIKNAEGIGQMFYNGTFYHLSILNIDSGVIYFFNSSDGSAAIENVTPTVKTISFAS